MEDDGDHCLVLSWYKSLVDEGDRVSLASDLVH